MHSATLEGPERFTQAAAAAQVTAALARIWRMNAAITANGTGQRTTGLADTPVAEAGVTQGQQQAQAPVCQSLRWRLDSASTHLIGEVCVV